MIGLQNNFYCIYSVCNYNNIILVWRKIRQCHISDKPEYNASKIALSIAPDKLAKRGSYNVKPTSHCGDNNRWPKTGWIYQLRFWSSTNQAMDTRRLNALVSEHPLLIPLKTSAFVWLAGNMFGWTFNSRGAWSCALLYLRFRKILLVSVSLPSNSTSSMSLKSSFQTVLPQSSGAFITSKIWGPLEVMNLTLTLDWFLAENTYFVIQLMRCDQFPNLRSQPSSKCYPSILNLLSKAG